MKIKFPRHCPKYHYTPASKVPFMKCTESGNWMMLVSNVASENH